MANKVKVKNVSGKTLNLSNGALKDGAVGLVTVSEASTLFKCLEKVEGVAKAADTKKK